MIDGARAIHVDDRGLACPRGGLHIDPWRPVPVAVITHAHSDHARPGHGVYHCSAPSVPLLHRRIGAEATVIGHSYGEPFTLGSALVSFHPAGHVLGSAQVRVEVDGEVWVVTGDYKRRDDPSCEAFELVPCDNLITEATFALPIYAWDDDAALFDELFAWWDGNAAAGRCSVLFGYALGKAQRLLARIHERRPDTTVFVHGAVEPLVRLYRQAGIALPPTGLVSEQEKGKDYAGCLALAPPSAFGTPWMRRFQPYATGFASGWMRVRGHKRRRGFDSGFVISDHCDWPDLLRTVAETGAKRVFPTHGSVDALARYLREQRGVEAWPLRTLYEGGTEED